MEETVRTPGKSMDFDYFTNELLPRIKNSPVINFMGGEPTLHPQFNDIFTQTLDTMSSYTSLGLFTNGLMGDKVLDLLVNVGGRDGALKRKITFSVLLNWQTLDNISEQNHERCQEVAETLMRKNGYSITFSINLYSKDQDIESQCEQIDAIYQNVGLPKDQQYRIRVSPAFPIVGGESNIYLPIRDYPKLGR